MGRFRYRYDKRVYAILAAADWQIKIGHSVVPEHRVPVLQRERRQPLVLLAQTQETAKVSEDIFLRRLAPFRAYGREWFHATPEVWAVVAEISEREAVCEARKVARQIRRKGVRPSGEIPSVAQAA